MAELFNLSPRRDSVVIFTGGLNEKVSNLELTPGELISCSNYMELAGRYHGYTSVKGYEVSDGATTTITGIVTGATHASDVTVVSVPDEGGSTDDNVTLLIESPSSATTFSDVSSVGATVTSAGSVAYSTDYSKFDGACIHFTGASDSLTIPNSASDYDFAQASASKTSTIEGYFQVPTARTATIKLAEKEDSWKLEVDTSRNVIFTYYVSSTPTAITGSTAMDANAFNHIRVTYAQDSKFRLFVAGTLGATSASGTPDESANDVVIGGTTDQFWMDSFRASKVCRGTHNFTVPTVPWSTTGFFDVAYDDSWREYKRGLCESVSGAGGATSGNVLRTHIYDSTAVSAAAPKGSTQVLAVRPASASSNLILHRQTSGNGWGSTSSTILSGATYGATTVVKMCNGRFSDYASNEEVCFITISTDDSEAFRVYNGDSNILVSVSAGTGILPVASAGMPIDCYAHDNRLFLAYPKGELYISGIGDPVTLWSGSTDNATLYKFPSEIVSVQHLSDNIVGVFCQKGIYMLKGTHITQESGGTGTGWEWEQSTITESTDVIANTVQRFGKTVYFVSKEGLKSLNTTAAFGDFDEGALSHKVNNTLLTNLDNIIGSTISKDYGQYRLYFATSSTNFALYFTFNEDGTIKGTTKVAFNQQDDTSATMTCVTHSDKSDTSYFGSSDGYVYKLDSGTSENGQDIETLFQSAYFHYGKPRIWKLIRSLLFELETSAFLEVTVKIRYGYNRSDLPRSDLAKFVKTAAGRWSVAVYGGFIWGGSVIGNPIFYPYGQGVNFSIEVSTSDRWLAQHTVNNVITDYIEIGRQF